RRGWMFLAQVGICVGLFKLSLGDPALGVESIALAALFVAFCAATQDIAMASLEQQGAMVAAYQVGYRIALICGSAGALTIAADADWHWSYRVMAMLGLV